MTESIQKKLLRVRPPRVKITYDVETGGAIEKRELPFIVGILADLAGDVPAEKPLEPLKDRKISDIDRDNFNDIMKLIQPRVDLAPVLKQDALKDLKASNNSDDKQVVFNMLDDFEPLKVIHALPTLSAKYRARGQVRGLQAKAESSDAVAVALDSWVGASDVTDLDRIQKQLIVALNGALPTADQKPALRQALAGLQNVLLKEQAAIRAAAKLATASASPADIEKAKAAATAAKEEADKAAAEATAKATAAATAKTAAEAADADDAAKAAAKTAADEADKANAAKDAADANKSAADAALMAIDPSATLAAAAGSIAALRSWGLLDDPAQLPTAAVHGLLLANALAISDTPDNRTSAANLLAALRDTGAPEATSSPEELLRYKLRDDATLRLKGQDGAATVVSDLLAQVGTPDPKAPAGDPSWARALLLLGLVAEDDAAAIVSGNYANPKEYQEASNQADYRGRTLSFAAYLNNGANADRKLVADKVFPLVANLRNEDSGVATAVAIQRLHYFAEQILVSLQAQDANLLKALKKGAAAIIDERVTLIDQYLSKALSTIMHSDSFKEVERTWRGLAYLVMRTETGEMLKLRVLNVGKDELRKDMEKAVEFDQSALFKMVYEAEYGTYGGYPYSLLVGGYELGGGADDIAFLKKISEVAAAAHAPFIAAASNDLFGLDGFDKLGKPRDLKKIFESQELEGWREFREMEDARYVSLVLPRVLLRLPYGRPEKRNTIQCEGLNFEEQVGSNGAQAVMLQNGEPASYPAPDNANFLWGNAAYILAERITNAFSLYNWTAAIRGVEGGGLVEGLPIYTYTSSTGSTDLLCPTEVSITDRREKELNDLGFISLCHCKGSGKAAFFGGQTTNQPKKYFSDDANANAKISAMLPYMLAASRFAHYIKVIMRDKVGSFLTRANVESYLNTWIANYVLLDDNAAQEVKASYPLRAAKVIVTEVPGEPGAYKATAFLRPHFQLEELTASLRLVANIPGG
ncbi:MAG TPA: type VI secretion system contractile sheath large subunit [Noviherbaspirillum sp.]|nr:type VI secretion system contractile sheath large subunit [Noviherbaspirillum sp.]